MGWWCGGEEVRMKALVWGCCKSCFLSVWGWKEGEGSLDDR